MNKFNNFFLSNHKTLIIISFLLFVIKFLIFTASFADALIFLTMASLIAFIIYINKYSDNKYLELKEDFEVTKNIVQSLKLKFLFNPKDKGNHHG